MERIDRKKPLPCSSTVTLVWTDTEKSSGLQQCSQLLSKCELGYLLEMKCGKEYSRLINLTDFLSWRTFKTKFEFLTVTAASLKKVKNSYRFIKKKVGFFLKRHYFLLFRLTGVWNYPSSSIPNRTQNFKNQIYFHSQVKLWRGIYVSYIHKKKLFSITEHPVM